MVWKQLFGKTSSKASEGLEKSGPLIRVLYGSQTGTAQKLAKLTRKTLEEQGFLIQLDELDAVDVRTLQDSRFLVILCSAQGEGDMPDNATYFWEDLSSDSAPILQKTSVSILALGDSAYDHFCLTGRQLSERFASLEAEELTSRVECDVELEKPFQEWLDATQRALFERIRPNEECVPPLSTTFDLAPLYTPLHLKRKDALTTPESSKQVWHYEFQSDLSYTTGDILHVLPHNDPALVDQILKITGCRDDESWESASGTVSLKDHLREHADLKDPSLELKEAWKEGVDAKTEAKADWQLLDYLTAASQPMLETEKWVPLLRPLQPRAYSISSSPVACKGEIHLTVASVRYALNEVNRKGVCSCFLADEVELGETVRGYITSNDHFRLPDNPETPIIMLGPGTGIAPFRAFLQERELTGARGGNWLFYGDRNRDSDFAYASEIERWSSTGLLSRLDVAFSRDQAEKRYITHCILESAEEFYSFLEKGAFVYVCGDATRMAPDVHAAMCEVIQTQSGCTSEESETYLSNLHHEHRYVRDVY